MAKKRAPKTSAEDFIKAVMTSTSVAEAAVKLGCTENVVRWRLRSYKKRGITGLPDFDGREVKSEDVQGLVNKYSKMR